MRGNSPLVRQWTLLRLLCSRPGGVTVRELMLELGVSEKTVRRDLEMFRKLGFPCQEQVGDHGRKAWLVQPVGDTPALSFAFDEGIALYLGRRFMEPLAGTVFWDAAQRAFLKVRTVLSPEALKYLQKFAGVFHQSLVGASDYSRKGELIDRLVMAMEDRRITHITYQSLQATEPVTYDVYPYGLVHHRGSLYLVGWAPRRQRIQHWKIDRIEEVEVTGLQFQRPEGFELRKHLAKSFGVFQSDADEAEVHVTVRFSPTVARYVQEGRWHPSQKLSRQKDGALLAEFDLSTTEEIKHWILSFGQHAIVLAPESLCQEMKNELRTMFLQYERGLEPERQSPTHSPRREPSHES
jgi:proteasome accessory factor B